MNGNGNGQKSVQILALGPRSQPGTAYGTAKEQPKERAKKWTKNMVQWTLWATDLAQSVRAVEWSVRGAPRVRFLHQVWHLTRASCCHPGCQSRLRGDGGNRCSRGCLFATILVPNRRQLPPPWLSIEAQGGCWELALRGVPFLFLFWRPVGANGCHPGCRSRHLVMAGIGAPKGAPFCCYSGGLASANFHCLDC